MRPPPDARLPGQESVWDYPRPAIACSSERHVRVEHGGVVVADTRAPVRVLKTSHPPGWYVPPGDVAMALLHPSERRSFCEWKGPVIYWHLRVAGETVRDAAWSYPDPTSAFAVLRDHVAFYAAPLDRCTVDGMVARPQPGDFYGGWITPDLAGPFKGVPASMGW